MYLKSDSCEPEFIAKCTSGRQPAVAAGCHRLAHCAGRPVAGGPNRIAPTLHTSKREGLGRGFLVNMKGLHACIMMKITSWPSYSHWAELLSIGQNRIPEKLNAFQVRRGAGLSFPKLQLDCRAPAAGLPSDLYQNSEAGPALTRTEPKR